jgi:predicted CXXCH cytochrome family protein
MKTNFSLVILLLLAGFSISANAQIAGTAHDFALKAWAPAENKVCGVCHTVHQAKAVADAPLWNHQTTAVASYTLYSSPTFNGSTTITIPSASSKLCLSCHDGTVALENFGAVTSGTNYISATNKIGGSGGNDMSKEHPISFQYTDALVVSDPGLKTPSTALSGISGGGTIAADLLFANKMECASCHDVHNKFNNTHLLKLSNVNSQLCLACHKK